MESFIREHFAPGCLYSSSADRDAFRDFFDSYRKAAQRRRAAATEGASGPGGGGSGERPPGSRLDPASVAQRRKALGLDSLLPHGYDPRFKSNLYLSSLGPVNYANGGGAGAHDDDCTDSLPTLRRCLTLFESFMHRKRFNAITDTFAARKTLPIYPYRDAILSAVASNRVVIVAGDTGCGKSTQVPQYLMEAGYGRVACTQPRRIATMALARRVSREAMVEYGTTVAYQVRFDKTSTAATRILFLTEGLLLRQAAGAGPSQSSSSKRRQGQQGQQQQQGQPQHERSQGDSDGSMLGQYDVIVMDEVHERHVSGDFLMAVLGLMLSRRPSLRLVLMSATINTGMFSRYYGGCPVVTVPGRSYPVTVEYCVTGVGRVVGQGQGGGQIARQQQQQQQGQQQGQQQQQGQPQHTDSKKRARAMQAALSGGSDSSGRGGLDPAPYIKILNQVDARHPSSEGGDMLVFLSGMADMQRLQGPMEEYSKACGGKWVVLMLHSALSVDDQDRVFAKPPPGVRKVVLATNIAETSVTIDGIRFVVDSGRCKQVEHDAMTKVSSLQETLVSRASADQRKGRAGRTGPGHCFRMYSQDTYEDVFQPFTTPEIARTPLEQLVLQIVASNTHLGVGPREFPFVEMPDPRSMDAAIRTLVDHGAIDKRLVKTIVRVEAGDEEIEVEHEEITITPLGRILSRLPLDIGLGKTLVLGSLFGDGLKDAVVTMAAALTVQSPFVQLKSGGGGGASTQHQLSLLWKPFVSRHGDPFSLLNMFDEWMLVRSGRQHGSQQRDLHSGDGGGSKRQKQQHHNHNNNRTGGMSSRQWCLRHGIEEQRLMEIAKLKSQFVDLLNDTLWKSEEERQDNDDHSDHSGEDEEEAREQEHKALALKRRKLRHERAEMDKARSKGVVVLKPVQDTVDGDGVEGGGGETTAGSLSLVSREFEMSLGEKLSRLEASSASRRLTLTDILTAKTVILSGMYPQVAAADDANGSLLAADALFHTRVKQNCSLHPSSAAAVPSEMMMSAPPSAAASSAGAGPVSSAPILRSTEVFAYTTLRETSKLYLTNVLRVEALVPLLLNATMIDTDRHCHRIVLDSWLLIEVDHAESAASSAGLSPFETPSGLLLASQVMRKRMSDAVDEQLTLGQGENTVEDDGAAAAGIASPVDNACFVPLAFQAVRDIYSKPAASHSEAWATWSCIDSVAQRLAELHELYGGSDSIVKFQVSRLKQSEWESYFKPPPALPVARSTSADHATTISPESGIYQDGSSKGRSGVRVAPHVQFDSLHSAALSKSGGASAAADESAGDAQSRIDGFLVGMSVHMQKHWDCPFCGSHLIVNMDNAREHLLRCMPPLHCEKHERQPAAKTNTASGAQSDCAMLDSTSTELSASQVAAIVERWVR